MPEPGPASRLEISAFRGVKPLERLSASNSALDSRSILLLNSHSDMRTFARLLWIAAFLVATYSWMVAFEHGFAWPAFREGFKVEWRNVATLLSGKKLPAPVPPAAETPKG